jgi:uncharacterized membrane protein
LGNREETKLQTGDIIMPGSKEEAKRGKMNKDKIREYEEEDKKRMNVLFWIVVAFIIFIGIIAVTMR